MNTITLHGKITKAAEMKLINIGREPTLVAVFTVVDIGLPYQQVELLPQFSNNKKSETDNEGEKNEDFKKIPAQKNLAKKWRNRKWRLRH